MFRYLLIDEDGTVTGTSSDEVAEQYSEIDTHQVLNLELQTILFEGVNHAIPEHKS